MTEHGIHIDLAAADQLGFALLADGGDLFDLSHVGGAAGSHLSANDPLLASLSEASGADLTDLLALEHGAAEHGMADQASAGHGHYLQLAGLDTSALIFPAPHQTVDPAPDAGHAPQAGTDAGHAPALSLDDILAAAADDLANFHTAAGGPFAANHGAVGSGFFTPFSPIEALPGLTEMHVIGGH
jgi:hypothetical protein